MRLDKLTIKAQEALAEAMALASQHGHPEITSLHILAALVSQEKGAVAGDSPPDAALQPRNRP